MSKLRKVQHQMGAERLRELQQRAETMWLRVVQGEPAQMAQMRLMVEDVENVEGAQR